MVYLIAIALSLAFALIYLDYRKSCLAKSSVKGLEKTSFFKDGISPEQLRLFGLFVLSVFPVWFITVFRYDVGTDYFYTYVPRYELALNGEWPFTEPVFNIMYSVLALFRMDVQWVFIITGTFIVFGMYAFCYKYSPMPLLSIALFFATSVYFSSLNNVRQYVAMVLALYGIFNKRTSTALVLFAFAGCTHLSGFVYVPVYFILKLAAREYSRKKFIIASLVCMVASYPMYLILKSILLLTQYAYFFEQYIDNVMPVQDLVINGVIFLLSLYYYDAKDVGYKKLAMLNVMSLVICFVGIFLASMELTSRILRLFTLFNIIFVCVILTKERRAQVKLAVGAVIVVAYSALTWVSVAVDGVYEVLPYKFIFGADK